jgi:hypothetical protein
MHHNRVDADRLHQRHILRKIAGAFLVAHGVATIFHDEGLAGEVLDIG